MAGIRFVRRTGGGGGARVIPGGMMPMGGASAKS